MILEKKSFWFSISILFYLFIILISFLVLIFISDNIAVKISEYGSVFYLLATICLSLWFWRKHRNWSIDILKGFLVVFIFWLLFVIVFSFSAF